MKNTIVITTIFEPSEEVQAYARLCDNQLIVVGDKKSPANWACEGVDYLPVEHHELIGSELAKVLPYNHYCRKMFGYLMAAQSGADVIIDTDDDNYPKSNWGFPLFDNAYDTIGDNLGFVNIYQWFSDSTIWPRGLPLDLISTTFDSDNALSTRDCKVGIWQGLVDDDPDVDAIYRLTSDQPCFFDERQPIVLSEGVVCPFNSQNTATRKELFPLLYLPAHVTFRFTDILRGLVAQPIMWLYGYTLGFTQATVVQNPHDYLKDFSSEIPMYLNCRKALEIVSASITANENLESNLHKAYSSLLYEGIVCDDEMVSLEAWLTDVQRISTNTRLHS